MFESIAIALTLSWVSPPALDAAADDPLSIVLPDDWTTSVTTVPHSRSWTFNPEGQEGDDANVSLRVQLDRPRPDFAGKPPRETAEAIFAFKTKLYADQNIPLESGPVTAANVAEIDGFACDFEKPDGGVEETFVAPIDEWLLLVTFSYRKLEDASFIAPGRAAVASIEFDFGKTLLAEPTSRFHDAGGRCAIDLPSTWRTRETKDNLSITLSVSPDEIEGEEFDVGCSILIWPRYSKSAPKELGGSDEKVRDGWIAFVGFVTTNDDKVVTLPLTDAKFDDIDGKLVEVARGSKDGDDAARHRLHFVAAKDDTLIDVSFRAPELAWPRYAPLFERALKTLILNVGRHAFPSSTPNSVSGRYGSALLFAHLLAPHLPEDYIVVLDPAPQSSAGWQTPNDKRRLMLTMRPATSAKEFASGYRSQLPPGWQATEVFANDLSSDVSEVGFTVELPNGREPFSHFLAANAGPGFVHWLNATLDLDDEEGREALKPLFAAFARARPHVSIAADRQVTFVSPGIRVRFAPPKTWTETFERSRAVIAFSGGDGAVALEVRDDVNRSFVDEGEVIEARMNDLTQVGSIETLGEKKLGGGQGGQDLEVTRLITAGNGARTFERTRTQHRLGHQVKLIVQIPLGSGEKPAAAEKRAAPIFTSLKIDASPK